jgi:hypothetical protein
VSEQPAVCKVCGQAIEAHRTWLRWGEPHAGVEVEGKLRSCTELIAESNYNAARRWTLQTFVRSLRWHAGRLRTRGATWTPNDLDERANKAVKEIEMLERQVDAYYAWSRK